jgi:REP element-mobilizing transposase RayT
MPRSKRLDIPGAIHHVIVRGLERRRIFNDDNDYLNFISRIEKSIKRTNAFCYAWVLMPNHLHLLIRTGKNPLSDIMRSVLTGYAVYYNKKNRRHVVK